jgi:hypothetical protein
MEAAAGPRRMKYAKGKVPGALPETRLGRCANKKTAARKAAVYIQK